MTTTPFLSLRRGLAAAALMGLATPALALNILVANDDSCNSEGINALADALEAAGHNVIMYAPAGEQSGKGSSISTNVFSAFDISNVGFAGPTPADNRFCVRGPIESPEEGVEEEIIASATPKDSVLVGLALLGDNRPDLVVSGTNDGANIGLGAIGSGTVGGALGAAHNGIPSIAISRYREGFGEEGAWTFEQVGEFVATVVAELEANPAGDGALLPELTALNINIPAQAPRGVVHTTLGPLSDVRFGPRATGDGGAVIGFDGFLSLAELVGEEAAEELNNNPDASVEDFAAAGLDTDDEASMHVAGYVTITTMDGDLTAKLRKRELMQAKLRALGGEE